MLTIPFVSKQRTLDAIDRIGSTLSTYSDSQLRDESIELQFLAKSGQSRRSLLPKAFALVREAAARTLGFRHFPVQLLGGIHLANGRVIEMETGQERH